MARPLPGQCLTCAHPERARIELRCANSRRQIALIAREYGLSKHSVWRHWRDHVPENRKASLQLAGMTDPSVDLDALKRTESETLLQRLVVEIARLQRIADACESVRNYQDATRASTAIVRVLELEARYLGEIRAGNTTIHQSFLLSPDWFQLRRVIATALRPYPDAQRAVLAALREHEAVQGADVSSARAIARPVLEHQPQEASA